MPPPDSPTDPHQAPDQAPTKPEFGPLSREGFDRLYRELASGLLAYVERLIAKSGSRLDPAEAEDICQSAFTKLLEALPDFEPKGPESFGKFLWTIAYHLFCDRLKRAGKAPLPLHPGHSDSSESQEDGDVAKFSRS